MYLLHEESGLINGTEEWEERQSEKAWKAVIFALGMEKETAGSQPSAVS